jgi:predicted alpha/beta-fold hydrolase
MQPFTPFFRNPHFQTIAGHYWPRPPLEAAVPVERRLFTTEPEVQVLVESQLPDLPHATADIVMIHGLEGSSQAGYMLGLSAAAVRAGYAAHRMNLRTCGGTENLCRTLYHGGLTSDLLAVLRQLKAQGRGPFYVVGFSLGGNIVLKLAGELGESAAGWIGGVCAVSTPLDLAACVQHMGMPRNWIYQYRFVRRMRQRMCATGRFSRRDFAGLRSIFDVDDKITAPAFGFGGAPNYYRTQSAIGYLAGIRVPTLLIQAKDDTFIPFEIFERDAVRANPCIRLMISQHGGHLGFLGRAPHRFWLDEAIMDWIGANEQRRDLQNHDRETP